MSERERTIGGPGRIFRTSVLIVVSICALCVALPFLTFFGPLVFETTITVSQVPLEEVPERFHPHFSPQAADISGAYSSATRECTFSYPCTREDFDALMEREGLSAASDSLTPEGGTLITSRQWGPGVASYEFSPNTQTATVTASAW